MSLLLAASRRRDDIAGGEDGGGGWERKRRGFEFRAEPADEYVDGAAAVHHGADGIKFWWLA